MTQASEDDRVLVHAYVDGELDPANARALEALLEQTPALAAERDRIEALQRALRTNFPLSPPLAGRIDVIGRTPAPVLVYGHRKHVISLTAVPAPGKPDASPAARSSEGYHLLVWTTGGVTYWAVSDMAAGDLARFADLFRTT